MKCPTCMQDCSVLVPGPTSHYVCQNPDCSEHGNPVQFRVVTDTAIQFPYNQIYVNRKLEEFYQKPYMKLPDVGLMTIQ